MVREEVKSRVSGQKIRRRTNATRSSRRMVEEAITTEDGLLFPIKVKTIEVVFTDKGDRGLDELLAVGRSGNHL